MSRTTTTAAAALLLALLPAPARAATAWDAPHTVTSAALTGTRDDPSLALAIGDGKVAAAWRADQQTARLAVLPAGGTSFGAPLTLAAETAPFTALSPAVAVSSTGRVDAAWAVNGVVSSDDAVRCATVAGDALSPCAAPVFDATINDNWRTQAVVMAAGGDGTTALAFEGPGVTPGWAFSRPIAAVRDGDAFPAAGLDGNMGVDGAGRNIYPRVAVGPHGEAVALWLEWLTYDFKAVKFAYRAAGGSWVTPAGDAARLVGGNIGAGNYDVAVDGAGTGWVVTARPLAQGGVSVRRVGPGGGDASYDIAVEATDPQIGVSHDGAVTVSWVAGGTVWAAHRAPGADTTFGAPEQIATAVSSLTGRHRLLVAPDGAVTVSWIGFDGGEAVVRSRTRRAGGDGFGAAETVRTSASVLHSLEGGVDAHGTVALGWQEAGGAFEVSVRRTVADPEAPREDVPATGASTPAQTQTRGDEVVADPVRPRANPTLGRPVLAPEPAVRRGAVVLRVRNTAGVRLTGTVVVERRVGKAWRRIGMARVAVAPGATQKVRLTLDAATRRLLARKGRVALRATARLRGAGSTVTGANEVVLRRTARGVRAG